MEGLSNYLVLRFAKDEKEYWWTNNRWNGKAESNVYEHD